MHMHIHRNQKRKHGLGAWPNTEITQKRAAFCLSMANMKREPLRIWDFRVGGGNDRKKGLWEAIRGAVRKKIGEGEEVIRLRRRTTLGNWVRQL
ncbi:hypothetical protein L596_017572 [Steinernema carpocapsae]|uniref:Uncharacterized protein n=1 Tax=Steinernema carpocapsae TaxID=34508 RepID=A0A4U5N225_STECR|nr:hypothetical protein L596_017572 [Steinernema carpocapsae]